MMSTYDRSGIRYITGMQGKWLTSALKSKNMSQSELARELSKHLGRVYDRSMIYKASHDKRRLQVDEVDAIVAITGFPRDPEMDEKVTRAMLTPSTAEAAILESYRQLTSDQQATIEKILQQFVAAATQNS